jgi:hypothetical protein
MKMLSSARSMLGIGALFAETIQLHAQHYPAGSEGIKGASLPPPGFYFEDYNSFYFSDRTPGYQGVLEHEFGPQGQIIPGFNYFSYVQAPRLLWMTGWKFLGADYGVAVKVPFAYKEHLQNYVNQLESLGGVPIGPTISSTRVFGLADIEVEPLILSWHLKQFDIVSGYAFWAPTGEYDHHKLFLLNLGNGYWTHMFTLGATWYPDKEKTWAISLLNRYEINTAQYSDLYVAPYPQNVASLSTTLGNIYTLEWAVSKTVVKGMDVGLTGYYQQQVTATEGPTVYGPTFLSERVHVAGIGPEVKVDFPKWGLAASLRYDYEFTAMDHPQGNLITLTVTKSF